MKTVFTNSQVAHVWAQQKQENGRADNIFFEGSKIYSYGRHFLAAEIHKVKGERVCLINSDKYSPTTGRHLSEIASAVRDLMPYFHVPVPSKLKDNSNKEYFKAKIEQAIESSLKTIKVPDLATIQWKLDRIQDAVNEANEFYKLIGLKPFKLPDSKRSEVVKHLKARLKRYQELNTPEMIEKKKLEATKKLALEEQKNKLLLIDKINQFRESGLIDWQLRRVLSFDLLRIQGDEVVTSGGARVPLTEAKRLLMAIKNGLDVKEKQIGHFTVSEVYKLDTDTCIKIGCHKILLSEAVNVLEAA